MPKHQHKRRKIELCNGYEILDTKATERKHSMFQTLRLINSEFKHYPSMTHAVLRDLRGNRWEIYRHDPWWTRLKIYLLAA